MDHLPPPIGGTRPQIPFEAEPRVYSPDDFVRLPGLYGYKDLDQLVEHGLAPNLDPKIANTFLQEWLYFAMLAHVLDEDVDSNHFYNARTRTVHTTRKVLENKIKAWKEREAKAALKKCTKAQLRYIRSSDALAATRRFISKHLSYAPQDDDDGRPGNRRDDDGASNKAKNEAHEAIDSRLTLSIAVLGEILQRERPILEDSAHVDREEFWQDPTVETRRWGYSKYCREQLLDNKWCLSEIRRLESTMPGVCEVYYASSMLPSRNHAHSNCTWDSCKAPRADPLGHVEGDCDGNCGDELGFDERRIMKIILNHKTPLVTYNYVKGELELHEFDLNVDPPKKFGALSHAWEDVILDIGNDARGGNNRRILQCRAKKMQSDFNKLINGTAQTAENEDVPFYVDVLCYPRQAAAQAIALNQMRLIYSKATEVLVWDRDLLCDQKLTPTKTIEMNVKIRLGNWTKSLWTLLEAVLAKNLNVAFSDGIVTFDELRKARDEAKQDLFHEYHHLYQAGHPFNLAVYQLRKLDAKGDPHFRRPQQVWNAVQFHKIDRTENEAPILAALMKLDVKDLAIEEKSALNETREERCNRLASRRMTKLLQLMNETPGLYIPAGLIFLPLPKLRSEEVPETKQYGWAPRSWLTRQAHPRSLQGPLRCAAIPTTNGLLVDFPGLIIHSPMLPLEDCRFWIPVAHSMHKWFKVVAYPDVPDFKAWWIKITKGCELSIILSEANPRVQGAIGVLVKPKGWLRNGQIQWVDILCRVWIRLETDRDFVNDLCASFRQYPERALFGTRLVEQSWCVDGVV